MRRIDLITALGFLLVFGGCVTAPKPAPLNPAKPPAAAVPAAAVSHHRVEKGQTLWRIARLYGMDVEELAKLNNIPDAAKLETGSQLIVPAGRKTQIFAPESADDDFIWPLRGKIVASFSQVVNNAVNKGINIEPVRGREVLASRGGTVAFYNESFLDLGRTIIIEHPGGFWTVYGRNQEVYVKPGDVVTRGMAIAKAGSSGQDKNVYLHFEIRKGSKSENPLFYLP